MNGWHYVTLIVVFAVAYYVGAKYPGLLAKVGL